MIKKIICCVILILICTVFLNAEDFVERVSTINKYLSLKKTTLTDFTYSARGRRDPFIPLVGIEQLGLPSIAEMKNLFPFTLVGIIYSENRKSLAIINDKILEKGGEVDGAKVLEIEENSVKLLWKKKIISLSLKEEKL